MTKHTFAVHSKTLGILVAVLAGFTLLTLHYMGVTAAIAQQVAMAGLIVGLLIFVSGMLTSFLFQVKKKKSIHHDDGTIAATALIRCMIAICIADEELDEREIKMISKIYKQLMNTEMAEDEILYAAEEMQREETTIGEELAHINNTLYDDLRTKILKASLYILTADGSVDVREEQMLEEIRKGLKYSKGKLERAKKAFFAERGLKSKL